MKVDNQKFLFLLYQAFFVMTLLGALVVLLLLRRRNLDFLDRERDR